MNYIQKIALVGIVLSTMTVSIGCKDADTVHSEQLGAAMTSQGAAMRSGQVPGPKTGAPTPPPAPATK